MRNPYQATLLGLGILALVVSAIGYIVVAADASDPLAHAGGIAVGLWVGGSALLLGILLMVTWLAVAALNWRPGEVVPVSQDPDGERPEPAQAEPVPAPPADLPPGARMSAVDARLLRGKNPE
ncbi:MAG: hypothetical protein JWP75_160 [Frondihabitans sp.]|nr:hypothetical protein [Frondihabitans sp.]